MNGAIIRLFLVIISFKCLLRPLFHDPFNAALCFHIPAISPQNFVRDIISGHGSLSEWIPKHLLKELGSTEG